MTMRRSLTGACLLYAFTATVCSIKCMSCGYKFLPDFVNCTGPTIDCPPKYDSCGTSYLFNGHLEPKNFTKNGVICPTCMELWETHDKCQDNYAMTCTGDETTCIDHDMGFLKTKGCATANACSYAYLTTFEKKCKEIDKASPLSVVNSLLCPVGQSYTDHCKYFPVHCEGEENVCLTEKIWTEFAPDTDWYPGKDKEYEFEVIRRCGKAAECNRVGTYSSNVKKFTVNTTCCNSSMCLSPVPTFPTQVLTENGLICPTCYAENARRCILDEPINCVGNENRCIRYIKEEFFDKTTTIQSFSGCTTSNICRLGSSTKKFFYKTNETFKTIRMELICSSSSMRLTIPVVSFLCFVLVGLRIIICIV